MEWVLQLLDEIDDIGGVVAHWSLGLTAALTRRRPVALHFVPKRRIRDFGAPLPAAMAALRAHHGLPR